MAALVQILQLFRSLIAQRNTLLLENAALRHQVAVLKRTVKRPRIKDPDRIFWIMMRRVLKDRQSALLIVKPRPSSAGIARAGATTGSGRPNPGRRAGRRTRSV